MKQVHQPVRLFSFAVRRQLNPFCPDVSTAQAPPCSKRLTSAGDCRILPLHMFATDILVLQ